MVVGDHHRLGHGQVLQGHGRREEAPGPGPAHGRGALPPDRVREDPRPVDLQQHRGVAQPGGPQARGGHGFQVSPGRAAAPAGVSGGSVGVAFQQAGQGAPGSRSRGAGGCGSGRPATGASVPCEDSRGSWRLRWPATSPRQDGRRSAAKPIVGWHERDQRRRGRRSRSSETARAVAGRPGRGIGRWNWTLTGAPREFEESRGTEVLAPLQGGVQAARRRGRAPLGPGRSRDSRKVANDHSRPWAFAWLLEVGPGPAGVRRQGLGEAAALRQAALQGVGEQQVRELGLTVGGPGPVAPLEAQVVGPDAAQFMGPAAHGHDAGPGGGQQPIQEQPREGEVAQVVGAELGLETILGRPRGVPSRQRC